MTKGNNLCCIIICVAAAMISATGCSKPQETKAAVKFERVDSLACSRYTYDAIARLSACTTERLYDYSEGKLCDAAKSISLAKMCCGDAQMISAYEEAQREIINAHTILSKANDAFNGTERMDVSKLVDSVDIDLLIDFYDCSENVIYPMSPQEVLYMADFFGESTVHVKRAILILYENYEKIKPKGRKEPGKRQKIDW